MTCDICISSSPYCLLEMTKLNDSFLATSPALSDQAKWNEGTEFEWRRVESVHVAYVLFHSAPLKRHCHISDVTPK